MPPEKPIERKKRGTARPRRLRKQALSKGSLTIAKSGVEQDDDGEKTGPPKKKKKLDPTASPRKLRREKTVEETAAREKRGVLRAKCHLFGSERPRWRKKGSAPINETLIFLN